MHGTEIIEWYRHLCRYGRALFGGLNLQKNQKPPKSLLPVNRLEHCTSTVYRIIQSEWGYKKWNLCEWREVIKWSNTLVLISAAKNWLEEAINISRRGKSTRLMIFLEKWVNGINHGFSISRQNNVCVVGWLQLETVSVGKQKIALILVTNYMKAYFFVVPEDSFFLLLLLLVFFVVVVVAVPVFFSPATAPLPGRCLLRNADSSSEMAFGVPFSSFSPSTLASSKFWSLLLSAIFPSVVPLCHVWCYNCKLIILNCGVQNNT